MLGWFCLSNPTDLADCPESSNKESGIFTHRTCLWKLTRLIIERNVGLDIFESWGLGFREITVNLPSDCREIKLEHVLEVGKAVALHVERRATQMTISRRDLLALRAPRCSGVVGGLGPGSDRRPLHSGKLFGLIKSSDVTVVGKYNCAVRRSIDNLHKVGKKSGTNFAARFREDTRVRFDSRRSAWARDNAVGGTSQGNSNGGVLSAGAGASRNSALGHRCGVPSGITARK